MALIELSHVKVIRQKQTAVHAVNDVSLQVEKAISTESSVTLVLGKVH